MRISNRWAYEVDERKSENEYRHPFTKWKYLCFSNKIFIIKSLIILRLIHKYPVSYGWWFNIFIADQWSTWSNLSVSSWKPRGKVDSRVDFFSEKFHFVSHSSQKQCSHSEPETELQPKSEWPEFIYSVLTLNLTYDFFQLSKHTHANEVWSQNIYEYHRRWIAKNQFTAHFDLFRKPQEIVQTKILFEKKFAQQRARKLYIFRIDSQW